MNNKLNLNQNVNASLTNNNCRHVYEINLNNEKNYFITLTTKNESEFNLRIYDEHKNIIKTKYDNNNESIFLADLHHDISDYNKLNSSDDDNSNYENDSQNDSQNESQNESQNPNYNLDFNSMIQHVIESMHLNNEKDNKIEIVIEIENNDFPNEDDLNAMIEHNNKKNNIIINFNNKIYLTPEKNGIHYITVTSDFNNQEGEYSLIIQEVEDLKFIIEKKIQFNENICYNSKHKFKSKKFFIELYKNEKYKLEGIPNIKFLVSKNNQKIISKNNKIEFNAKYDGKYEIEVIPLNKDIEIIFSIIKINEINEINEKKIDNYNLYNKLETILNKLDKLEEFNNKINKIYKIDIYKTKKIILVDDDNDEFELCIENKELKINPY